MGSARQEGGSEGRGLGLGAQQAPQCLSGQGKHWPYSLPFLCAPPCLLQGLPRPCWTPNRGWVPLGVGTPPLPQPPLRGAGPVGLAFTFAPTSLSPTPSGPAPLEPRWAEHQAQDLSQLLGAQVGRGNLAMLPFHPLPSQWSPSFPLRVWDPFPSPSHPSGAQGLSHLHFSSPFTPPTPHILPGLWGFLLSPYVSVVPHRGLVGALVVQRRKFPILLVCPLDSAPPT